MKKINWHSHPLTTETVISTNYKTSQNVRRFFNSHLQKEVKLGSEFMAWMKANTGKTLGEALEEFKKRRPEG